VRVGVFAPARLAQKTLKACWCAVEGPDQAGVQRRVGRVHGWCEGLDVPQVKNRVLKAAKLVSQGRGTDVVVSAAGVVEEWERTMPAERSCEFVGESAREVIVSVWARSE
jgi:hypothetical protein